MEHIVSMHESLNGDSGMMEGGREGRPGQGPGEKREEGVNESES